MRGDLGGTLWSTRREWWGSFNAASGSLSSRLKVLVAYLADLAALPAPI
jgi:hypothetical protein